MEGTKEDHEEEKSLTQQAIVRNILFHSFHAKNRVVSS